MRIHLLHSNDIHSQIENYCRFGTQFRILRDRLRKQGDIVLSFDLGDVLDRVRPETEATYGRINAKLLGELELDGFVFGNNEGLTIPVEIWPELVKDCKTCVFGTNIRQSDGKRFPFFTDWKVFEYEHLRIGVFGLTPNYEGPYGMLHIQVMDPFSIAQSTIRFLRKQGCDIVICLSHLGLWDDRRLAEQVPGIDVIIGGHTHQFMKQAEFVGHTAVFQAGKHGLAFGHTEIEFADATRQIVSVSCELIDIPVNQPLDDRMYTVYLDNLGEVNRALQTTVTKLNEKLSVQFDVESTLANLLVDAMFYEYPCDLGIMMSGALTACLLPGDVHMGNVHGSCPTPTRPIMMSLTGKDIKQIIEKGVTEEYFLHRAIGYGFRGAVVGYLAVANMEIALTGTPDKRSVQSIHIGGRLLEEDREYRVITCEFLWLSPVFGEFKNGTNITFYRPLVRELLRAYLAKREHIEHAQVFRYHNHSMKSAEN